MSSPQAVDPSRPDVRDSGAALALLGVSMVAGLASLTLTLLDIAVPGRALIAVAALVSVPGIPIVVASRLGSLEVQLVLGVALSLACWLLTSQTQLQTGLWSPFAGQAVLTIVAVAAALVALATQRDSR